MVSRHPRSLVPTLETFVMKASKAQSKNGVSRLLSRRHFLNRAGLGLGAVALASLLNDKLFAAQSKTVPAAGGLPGLPHFVPTAKRVIYLFQSGAPSQMDLFDPKPKLAALRGADLP